MESKKYTGLILVSGIDTPGITQKLFETLSPFSLSILDIEQVVIRDRLILTVLISLSPAHADAIEEDLNLFAGGAHLDLAVSFQEQEISGIGVKSGLSHVVIIGNPPSTSSIAAIAAGIAEIDGNIERIHRTASYPITALEFVVSHAQVNTLKEKLSPVAALHNIDIAVSPGGLMRWAKKLVVMDVDSTLIQQEVIELLGRHAGVEEEIKAITDRAMNGEIDFEQSLRERVSLLKGLPESVLDAVRDEITLTPGARTLVTTLQSLGHAVAVVSGGFTTIIEPLLKELGINLYRANSLAIESGFLTGEITGAVIDRAAKAEALRDFARETSVELAQTIAIGDGANDLDMISLAGLGIAFNAKPSVKAQADSTVSAPYLDSVLYLLGINREDVEAAGGKRK